ncbi:MAG: hypothetical protein ACFCU5_01445, partial [Pleurocapsa sp.]
SIIMKIITKPETQALGQKVAERLTQKVVARSIRNLLLEDMPPAPTSAIPVYNQPALVSTTSDRL